MNSSRPCRSVLSAIAILGTSCVVGSSASAQNPRNPGAQTKSLACPHDDSGLELPAGFCATVFAGGVGHARQLVVAPNGVVYVNTWSGRYYGSDTPHAGGFLVALRDTTGSGKADVIQRFGETAQSGGLTNATDGRRSAHRRAGVSACGVCVGPEVTLHRNRPVIDVTVSAQIDIPDYQ
jgi:glucose/arabinose dehydrogenase